MNVFRIEPGDGWHGVITAAAKACPGDEIRLGAGRYDCGETLHMPPGVHLAGEGEVLLCSTHTPLIAVIKAEQCTITGLNMQCLVAVGGQTVAIDGFSVSPCLVFVVQASNLEIADCTLNGLDSGSQHVGILIRQSNRIAVQRCNISRLTIGIWLLSTAGAMLEGNRCIKNMSSGITAARDSDTPDAPTNLTARNNLCEGNKQAGIHLFSAQATLEGNRCIGNEMGGIVAGRDSDAPTDLTARNNHCEGNKEAGIVLLSAPATLEGNRCIDNEKHGIYAGRDANAPDAPTDLTARNNHCEGNKEAGIVLRSARATLEGNRCIGNEMDGIAAQRDANAPDAPTDLTARNNHCEGNKKAGIALLSAQAMLEGNRCIGNEMGGIVAVRDSDAPDAPTDLTARNNLCEGNKQAGIALLSARATLEGNHCIGNEMSGILASRDSDAPDSPTDLTARNNLCEGNKQAGIVLFSVQATLEGNHCIGNGKFGIAAERDSNAPDAPTDLTARNNLCEGNKVAGIVLHSAQATLEGNRCIGNERGIHAMRHLLTPDAPTDLTARNNLCEGNKEAGIMLLSARATLEGNRCIGNERAGIVAGRDSDAPDAPTDLTVRNNLCEGNKEAGIMLLSAQATLEGNRCIGNEIGIAAEPHPDAPDAPTDLTARNNHCEGNGQWSIWLKHCLGSLNGNAFQCGTAGMVPVSISSPVSGLYPGHWRALSNGKGKTCLNLLPGIANESEIHNEDALASLIRTGGCPHCFHRYWLGDIRQGHEMEGVPRVPDIARPSPALDTETTEEIRFYEVTPTHGNGAKIVRCKKHPFKGKETIGTRLANTVNQLAKGDMACLWAVAHASPSDAVITETIEALKKYPIVRVIDLDLAPNGTELSLADLLANQLIERHSLRGARLRALACIPATGPFLMLMIILLLAVLVPFAITGFDAGGYSTLPRDFFDALTYWQKGVELAGKWATAQSLLIWLPLLLVPSLAVRWFNRQAPTPLQLEDRIAPILGKLRQVSDIFGQSIPTPSTQSLRDENLRIYGWLKFSLFGHRWFGMVGRPSDLVLVLRNVETLAPEKQAELRLWSSLRNKQVFVSLTHVPGLAVLTDTWLDVWFGDSATSS